MEGRKKCSHIDKIDMGGNGEVYATLALPSLAYPSVLEEGGKEGRKKKGIYTKFGYIVI